MKTKIRIIRNSCRIIIGKKVLDQFHVTDEITLTVKDSKIIIEAIKSKPRKDWEEKLLKAKSLQNIESLEYFDNNFDKTDWTW